MEPLPCSSETVASGKLDTTDDFRKSNTSSTGSSTSINSRFLQTVFSLRPKSAEVATLPSSGFNHHGRLGLQTLSVPSDPLVEYVFIHGLGGGSTRTWCLKPDPSYFWPKEWLPRHPGFRNVRVHSFGYDSAWKSKGQSTATTYDFGQALLLALRNSECFSSNPIVLVAHSMGGIVAKEAYMMAKQDSSCHDLASRIVAMVFLGTPHRGSSHATYLSNLLQISPSHGTKLYVSDLERVSATLTRVNDTFRHYCDGLILYSFFETKPLSMGTASAVIVPKDSAVMGLPGERVSLLYADHRSMCKFESSDDPNYLSLVDAFTTINTETFGQLSTHHSDYLWDQLRKIEAYMGMPEIPEDDLNDLNDLSIPGSCDWFTDGAAFQTWLSTPASSSKLYWVYAQPAAGKSVLASHVVKVTDGLNHGCSYWFFRHGDMVRSSLSSCLLSLAYQMATFNIHVRNKLLQVVDRGVRFEPKNAKSVWRKVVEPILLSNDGTFRPQYWVLDALDECSDIASLFSILSRFEPSMPVKIFVTSRRLESITAGFAQLENNPVFFPFFSNEIQIKDTRDSIYQFLKSNNQKIHVGTEEQREDLILRIIDRAQGCFLWVRLVLEELNIAWTMGQIERVLDDVPQEMDQFYSRAVEQLLARPAHSVNIAKAILTWTMCAIRPLSTAELQSALQLEIGTTVQDPEDAIPSLCCQLVHVDRTGRVLMVHLTARTFLQERGLESPLTFCPIPGHLRIVQVCLGLLTSDAMKPPKASVRQGRTRGNNRALATAKKGASSDNRKLGLDLLHYAAFYFAEHMRRTTSKTEAVSPLLHEFLGKKNVFTWIEYLAKHDGLHILTQTANHIKNFYQRQAKYFLPLSEHVQLADGWATDLHRLIARFGTILARRPSSIYSLIPPFCPTSSAIASVFGKPARCIEVVGIENTSWDIRVACIDSGGAQCYAVASGERFFAVGFGSSVVLHHAATCQRWRELDHDDIVQHIGFDHTGTCLVSAGRRTIKVWDLEGGSESFGTPRHAFTAAHDILTLSLQGESDELVAALRNHTAVRWSLQSGEVVAEHPWRSVFADEGHFRRPPQRAAFSPDESLMAIVYRGRPIVLWDLAEDDFLGFLGRETDRDLASLPLGSNTSPSSLVFHPNESVPLLAVSYEDGDLCLFDYGELKLVKMIETQALVVTCSPDGATLVTGDWSGTVQMFAFETLQLLFRVNAMDAIRAVCFSADSLRLIDARGTQCNVWEPSLPSGTSRGDYASSNSESPEPRIVGVSDGEVNITAMATEESGEWFFVGKSDGSVWLYKTSDGKAHRLLYRHAYDASVMHMVWGDRRNVLVTADSWAHFGLICINRDANGEFADAVERMDLRRDIRGKDPIVQLLLNKANDLFLVSTAESDTLWDLKERVRVATVGFGSTRPPFRWVNSPLNDTQRLLISTTSVEVWDWQPCGPNTGTDRLKLLPQLPTDGRPGKWCVKSVSEAPNGRIFVEYSNLYPAINSDIPFFLLDASALQSDESKDVVPSRSFASVAHDLTHFIGISGSKLFYLDNRLGICSIEFLEGARRGFRHVNHCFIPNDWCNTRGSRRILVTGKGDILFVRREGVAVVKHAAMFEDEIREVSG